MTQLPLLFDMPRIATVRLTEHWHVSKDGDPVGLALYERHYSCYHYKDGRDRKLFCGPGEKLVLLNEPGNALFVWRRFIESGQTEPKGVNCAIFRNESEDESSGLILEAERVAWCRWPEERLYTYVNPEKVESEVPAWCFIRARWKRCGTTLGGLFIFEKLHPAAKARKHNPRKHDSCARRTA